MSCVQKQINTFQIVGPLNNLVHHYYLEPYSSSLNTPKSVPLVNGVVPLNDNYLTTNRLKFSFKSEELSSHTADIMFDNAK